MNPNFNGEKGAADCGSFFLESKKINENTPQIDFHISVETAKNGKEILVINGKAVHSRFAPEREACGIKYAAKSVIAVFGLGAGYHIKNLLSANPESYCIILEPLLPVFNRRKDFLGDLLDSRAFVVNSVQDEQIFKLLQKFMRSEFLRLETYSNLCYKNLFPQTEIDFYKIIQQHLAIVMQNILTESNFLPLWNKNILRNIIKTSHIPFLQPSQQKISKENIAVICAAGPTLDSQLSLIKSNREKLTVFAADTALIPLTKSGIIPDVIVSLDGQYFTMGDFICPLPAESLCVVDALGYYDVANRFQNAAFSLSSFEDGTLINYILKRLNIKPLITETGGTVTDYTLDLARQFGFKTFFFAGYDLSYPQSVTHCKNAPSWQSRIANSDYFTGIEDSMLKAIFNRRFKEAIAANGKTVVTDFVMDNYRNYLEYYLEAATDCDFFSDSTEAVKINGVKYQTLEKTITDNPQTHRIAYKNLNIEMICANIDEIEALFSNMTDKLYQYSQDLKNYIDSVSEWNEENTENIKNLIEKILISYPFLKRFLLMTQIVLDRNHVIPNSPEYLRHTSFCLLQSMYFMIRELQKAENRK